MTKPVRGGNLGRWGRGETMPAAPVSRDANRRITAGQIDAAIRALHGACPMGPRLSQSTVMIMLAAAEEVAESEREGQNENGSGCDA